MTMQPDDPIDTINETTIELKIAVATVVLCARYFSATTVKEFDLVERSAEWLMVQRPAPQDALMLLYNQVIDAVRDQALLMSEVEDWARTIDTPAEVIEIEPVAWEMRLRVGNSEKRVRVQKGWNMELDEFEAIITEINRE